jgi:hypothetical protein
MKSLLRLRFRAMTAVAKSPKYSAPIIFMLHFLIETYSDTWISQARELINFFDPNNSQVLLLHMLNEVLQCDHICEGMCVTQHQIPNENFQQPLLFNLFKVWQFGMQGQDKTNGFQSTIPPKLIPKLELNCE